MFIMNSLLPFSKGTDAKPHYSTLKFGTNAVWVMAGCLNLEGHSHPERAHNIDLIT
jgi:hypothetical protein